MIVEDLGSTNGTYVNGRRITAPRLLSPGDTLKLGETTLSFDAPAPTEAAAQPTVRARVAAAGAPADAAPALAGTAPPPTAVAAASGGGSSRRAVYGVLAGRLVAGAIVAIVLLSSGRPKTTSVAPGAGGVGALPADVQGVVYVQSNIAQPNGNSVLEWSVAGDRQERPLGPRGACARRHISVYTDTRMANTELRATLFHGFSERNRLRILEALVDGERRVSDIVEVAGLAQPNVSTHLACLWDCGLVARERRGREVFYRLIETGALLEFGDINQYAQAGATVGACPRYGCGNEDAA